MELAMQNTKTLWMDTNTVDEDTDVFLLAWAKKRQKRTMS
jgi:hypothetical protein